MTAIEALIAEAETILGDEGRAIAENVGKNLTEATRQQRNALEAGVDAHKSKPDLIDATNMDLTPGQDRNLKASFGTHLQAMARRVADTMADEMKATKFFHLDGSDARIIDAKEYADTGLANLGAHPHSRAIAVPIPPGYEHVAPDARRILALDPSERRQAFLDFLNDSPNAAPSGPGAPPPSGPAPKQPSGTPVPQPLDHKVLLKMTPLANDPAAIQAAQLAVDTRLAGYNSQLPHLADPARQAQMAKDIGDISQNYNRLIANQIMMGHEDTVLKGLGVDLDSSSFKSNRDLFDKFRLALMSQKLTAKKFPHTTAEFSEALANSPGITPAWASAARQSPPMNVLQQIVGDHLIDADLLKYILALHPQDERADCETFIKRINLFARTTPGELTHETGHAIEYENLLYDAYRIQIVFDTAGTLESPLPNKNYPNGDPKAIGRPNSGYYSDYITRQYPYGTEGLSMTLQALCEGASPIHTLTPRDKQLFRLTAAFLAGLHK